MDLQSIGRAAVCRRALCTIFAVMLGAAVLAAGASAAPLGNGLALNLHPPGSASIVGPATGTIHYARNQSVCPKPAKADEVRCFAMIRVPVAKGTTGAIAYRALSRPINAAPNSIGPGPAGGYTPDDLAAAYGYNANVNRSSQLIALVDWYNDPNVVGDLNTFDQAYGLPNETSSSFRVVNEHGAASPLPADNQQTSVEESLDVDAARAVCHTCRLVLIEANTPTDADLSIAENEAVHMGATEISNSFGGGETKLNATTLAAFNHPGVVITASTGDNGWYGWAAANNTNGKSANSPEFPSTDPNVVAVGGTSLDINSSGARTSEDVWNDNGADDLNYLEGGAGGGAGGGGCSMIYKAPAWQSHYSGYSAARCGGKRLAADVAADADPETGFDVYDSYVSGWITVGGTSLASPLLAGMWALADGAAGTAYPASTLYVNGTYRKTSHYDVAAGGNGFCGGDTTTHCAEVAEDLSNDTIDNPNGLGVGLAGLQLPAQRSKRHKCSRVRFRVQRREGLRRTVRDRHAQGARDLHADKPEGVGDAARLA